LRQAGISGIKPDVSADAAATANTILMHEPSLQLGFALGLISIACYITLTGLLYQVFKPVSRSLALLATLFGLTGLAIQAFAALFQLAPLVLLGGSPYLHAFSTPQLQALALVFLQLNAQAGAIYLVFDALFQLLTAYLIARSTFLPRILGVPLALAGL